MGETKRVARGNEPTIGVEVVVQPVVVQHPAIAIPVEVPHVAVAIRIHPDEICRIPSMPPPFEYSQG